jgi:hypothetical protein
MKYLDEQVSECVFRTAPRYRTTYEKNPWQIKQLSKTFGLINVCPLHKLKKLHVDNFNPNSSEIMKNYIQLLKNVPFFHNLNEKLLGTGDENGNKIEELNFENLALEQQKLYYEGRIIERFLTETASQLTYSGLIKLYEFLTDRHLAVFFRNNHFSTLFFYQGQIFLLVTDFGFIDQSDVVWELVSNISG